MKTVFVFRCLNGQLLTIRATNLNFLEFKASAGPKVLISLLYEYVEGHMTLDDFSWTDPLSIKNYEFNLTEMGAKESVVPESKELTRVNWSNGA